MAARVTEASTTNSSGGRSVVTPSGKFSSPTRTPAPTVRPEMSISRLGGIRPGVALTVRELSNCSTMPFSCSTALASPTIRIGTSAEMISSRRTIWKSTWMTVWRTGWRCRARAMARWVSDPTWTESSWLRPVSPDRA